MGEAGRFDLPTLDGFPAFLALFVVLDLGISEQIYPPSERRSRRAILRSTCLTMS